jgi:hypothetical protein
MAGSAGLIGFSSRFASTCRSRHMGNVTASYRLRFRSITSTTSIRTIWAALALLLGACGPAARPPEGAVAGEWRTFGGSWTASGTRTTLDLESDHRASIVQMNGSLLLKGERTLGIGFRAEFVGFTDSRSGMVGRAVWTDERGDRVFSELKGEWVGTGNHIAGTFLGGTGRYAGITGEYEFQWQYVLAAEDGAVSGRTTGLKGRARVNEPPASAPPAGGPAK